MYLLFEEYVLVLNQCLKNGSSTATLQPTRHAKEERMKAASAVWDPRAETITWLKLMKSMLKINERGETFVWVESRHVSHRAMVYQVGDVPQRWWLWSLRS